MASDARRALVVDDEEAIRKLVASALRKLGYECELAADGEQAAQMAGKSQFDVVVTDLRMPIKNGHALVLEMLEREDRPLIIVYTGVIEPRLAKDLLARGVDDILFKPADFGVLAAKVQTLMERRCSGGRIQQQNAEHSATSPSSTAEHSAEHSAEGPINLLQLNAKIAELSTVLPVSNTALDVYGMTRSYDWKVSQIAAAIQRDASLAADVLRLANSSLYNQSGRRIIELDEAVLRIGQNRVSELALTANALAALTPGLLPWLDLELTWKRSMAAGIVVESLVEIGGHQAIEEGLLLCSIMHPLGRVALAMLFPQQYEAMIASCGRAGDSLQEHERKTFPTTHTEVMAHLLATWRIPTNVFLPLKFSLDDFSALARLSEPTRTRTELVKVAVVLGRLAVDRWEPWDVVQFPPSRVLKRLQLADLAEIVRQTRSDLSKLADFHPGGPAAKTTAANRSERRPIIYCNVAESSEDLFGELLPSLGFQPERCTVEELPDVEKPCIVNCSGAATRFAARGARNNTVIVSDDEQREVFACLAPTIALPNSYGRIRDLLHNELRRREADQPGAAKPCLAGR